MNWNALAKTLDITTEIRPVYRAGKRGFLTKDSAMRDAIKGIAKAVSVREIHQFRWLREVSALRVRTLQ